MFCCWGPNFSHKLTGFRTQRLERLDDLLRATRAAGLGFGASGYSAAVMAAEQAKGTGGGVLTTNPSLSMGGVFLGEKGESDHFWRGEES